VAPPRRDWDSDYLARKDSLAPGLRFELELIEERIVTDPTRTYQRTFGPDGVVYDLSGLDDTGFVVAFLPLDDGKVFRFVGFTHES
jgi:hypothetical protein